MYVDNWNKLQLTGAKYITHQPTSCHGELVAEKRMFSGEEDVSLILEKEEPVLHVAVISKLEFWGYKEKKRAEEQVPVPLSPNNDAGPSPSIPFHFKDRSWESSW